MPCSFLALLPWMAKRGRCLAWHASFCSITKTRRHPHLQNTGRLSTNPRQTGRQSHLHSLSAFLRRVQLKPSNSTILLRVGPHIMAPI
ncbi:hypothetical protein V8C43DRAFT_268784 [Trichoderma afarasin]